MVLLQDRHCRHTALSDSMITTKPVVWYPIDAPGPASNTQIRMCHMTCFQSPVLLCAEDARYVHAMMTNNPMFPQAYLRQSKTILMPTILAIGDGLIDEIIDCKDSEDAEQDSHYYNHRKSQMHSSSKSNPSVFRSALLSFSENSRSPTLMM